MGLTFPTAFVKKQDSSEEAPTISWQTGAFWSHGNGSPTQQNFSLKQSSSFPFSVEVDGLEDEYYTEYDELIVNDYSKALPSSSYIYYGWFLHGGDDSLGNNIDLSQWHRLNPWEVSSDGLNVSIQNESDLTTAYTSGYFDSEDYGFDFAHEHFNKFTQSGEATGSFTLSSTKTLTIKISGLGSDTSHIFDGSVNGRIPAQIDVGEPGDKSIFSNTMTLSLYNSTTDTMICSGRAPMDDRLLDNSTLKNQEDLGENDLSYNIDVQQVKLYNVGSQSIVNTNQTPNTKGEPRAQSTKWVEQGSRVNGYTTTNGIGTFTQNNLAAGNYEIRIKASTYEPEYNSGAFYGFTFSFS
tara:strand:+ start:12472 stop:13527 length:1056 start_codon:yes stop_codon:yes gene_type:complete